MTSLLDHREENRIDIDLGMLGGVKLDYENGVFRRSHAGNNPLIYIDPTGHLKLKKLFKAIVTGIVAGAVFFATGGTAAPLLSAKFILAGIAAGAAAGATSAALNGGKLGDIVKGAVFGAALGGVASVVGGVLGPIPTLVGGGAYATAKDGLNGLAYYAAGLAGAYIGASGAQYVKNNWSNWFAAQGNEGAYIDSSTPTDSGSMNSNQSYASMEGGDTNQSTIASIGERDNNYTLLADNWVGVNSQMNADPQSMGPILRNADKIISGAKKMFDALKNPPGPPKGGQALKYNKEINEIIQHEFFDKNKGYRGPKRCVEGCHPD